MPKGNIKADVLLRLDGWVKETEPPVLALVSSEDELAVSTAIVGTIEVSASRFYQLMKAQKVDGKLPLLRLVVIDPDAQMKQAELEKQKKEDKKSPKLDLTKKGKKDAPGKEAQKQTNAEKAAAVRKGVEEGLTAGKGNDGKATKPKVS